MAEYTFHYDGANNADRELLKSVYAIAKVEGYLEDGELQQGLIDVVNLMWNFLYELMTESVSSFRVEIEKELTDTERRLVKISHAKKIIEELDKDSTILENIDIEVVFDIDTRDKGLWMSDRENFITNGGVDSIDRELTNDDRHIIQGCISRYFGIEVPFDNEEYIL